MKFHKDATGLFFNGTGTNCTYTSAGGKTAKFSINTLLELQASLPKPPKIMVMKTNVFQNKMLPDNWIMISPSIAEALEEAMKEKK